MRKENVLEIVALFLISMLIAIMHVTLDQSLREALETGNVAMRAATENGQWILMGFELILIIGIIIGIGRNMRSNAN